MTKQYVDPKMTKQYVDLHVHSTASDGTFSPAELVRKAHEAGLAGMALTDHDTVAGIAEAEEEARRVGIELMPGIEISAISPTLQGTLHILGYCIDRNSPALAEMTGQLVEARNERNPKIIARLRELGIEITMEEVESAAGGDVVGRPHIAGVLVKKGVVSSINQAFKEYLGDGQKAFVEKERLTPRAAIQKIRDAGGIAVLAHPVQLRASNDAELERVVKDLVDMGLEGIEVIHSDHNEALVQKYLGMAKKFVLVPTGGSDFHGDVKYNIKIGWAKHRRVPKLWMDAILEWRELGRIED